MGAIFIEPAIHQDLSFYDRQLRPPTTMECPTIYNTLRVGTQFAEYPWFGKEKWKS